MVVFAAQAPRRLNMGAPLDGGVDRASARTRGFFCPGGTMAGVRLFLEVAGTVALLIGLAVFAEYWGGRP